MKKILAILVLGLGFHLTAMAQPTFSFTDESACTGETVCFDVKVKDFTDILFMSFTMEWDPAVLQFQQVTGFGLPGLTAANFNTGGAATGTTSVSWQFGNCPAGAGRTEADGHIIFQVCFTVLSSNYGEATTLDIASTPVPVIYRTNVGNCTNIGMFVHEGVMSTCVRPFSIIASDEAGNTGDLICVDFKVTGFDDMRSTQFSVRYDPTVLEFQNVIPGNVPNLSVGSSFGLPGMGGVQPGELTCSWAYFIPGEPAVTLPDSTLFFQACFRIIGNCETSSAIRFDSIPTAFEFTNDNNIAPGFNITFLPVDGFVQVGDCMPTGLQLVADCGAPVNLNDQVCVKVRVGNNFTNISDAAFLMEWNPSILSYTGVQSLATLSGLNLPDFNASNASNGILGFNWMPVGPPTASLAANTTLFEVCFEVIGLGGSSPFSFSEPANVQINNGNNIGINPSNCEVVVNQPQGVVMMIGDGSAAPGDPVCLDVTVSNFDDILSYQFSLAFDPAHMAFTGIQNINLPEATLANFTTVGASAGSIFFDWEPSTAHTVPDGTVIAQICFEPVGPPQQCDVLEVVGLPLIAEAINTTSNGENIGVVDTPGEVCILFPEGFGLVIDSIGGFVNDTTCISAAVVSFDNITSASFGITWDPSELEFVNVNTLGVWTGLTASNFNNSGSPVGLLNLNWTNATPVAIPDSTPVFELCFHLIGEPRTCNVVGIDESVTPVVTTSNGTGSMLYETGLLCINDRFIVDSIIITPVSCPDACDGEIRLVVSGGQAPISSTWETANGAQFSQMIMATNLCVGEVSVTVFDLANPSTILRDTFDIPLTDDLPIANAGEDKTLNCPLTPNGNFSVLLSGTGSTGSNYTYEWINQTSGQVLPTNPVVVQTDGPFILQVTDSNTGCSTRDTMIVSLPVLPTANAGVDLGYTCLSDTLSIDGTLSTSGPNIQYVWTALNGPGSVLPSDVNLADPRVTGPGVYELAVRITLNNCTDRDTITVADERIIPNANGGPDLELGCSGAAVTLDASPSDNTALSVSYEWFDQNGGLLGSGITQNATELGFYVVVATEETSQCTKADTVMVIPSNEYPDILLDEVPSLTCNTNTVTLSATVSPDTIMYTIQWNALDGGSVTTPDALTTETSTAGLYELVISNTQNGCISRDTAQVMLDTIPPVANAGANTTLTCATQTATLDGSASDQGPGFEYIWRDGDDIVIGMGLTVTVNEVGTYCLEVIDDRGCSAIDCVTIGISGAPPVVLFQPPSVLTCLNDTIFVTADASPPNPNYQYSWTALGTGNITGPTTASTISVDSPGDYEFTVLNPATGCSTVDTVTVSADQAPPTAIAAADVTQLTCTTGTSTLDGTGSSEGVDFTYEWSNIVAGELPSPNNALTVPIDAAGTYEIEVLNISNGCSARDTVVITQDTLHPNIVVAAPNDITCTALSSSLNATGSTPATGVTIEWTAVSGGGAITSPNSLMASTSTAGTYQISITNNANGCESTESVTVAANNTPPTVSIAPPASFSCTGLPVSLNATASGAANTFSSITWSSVGTGGGTVTPASGSLTVQVSGPGDYALTLVSAANGCSKTDTVTVAAASDTPVADAGQNQNLDCGDVAQLGGPNTTGGAGFSLQWTVISGATLSGSTTTPTTTTEGSGTYQLIVTNTANGCRDTATVEVTFMTPGEANAGEDASLCEDGITLNGNQPSGATGQWTSLSGAVITAPDQPTSDVTGLDEGENLFIWTLSAPGCPSYSADTVAIRTESSPVANNDLLEIPANSRDASVNLSANDIVNGDWSLSLVNQPTFGTATIENGVLSYSVNRGAEGQLELIYQICSVSCPGRCDTATVAINVISDGVIPERPNTITPNEDGLNETLIFDEILNNPADKFPDNELIVFNRWGDIVYQSKPYNNDWNGTNSSGQELPHGTYYYILRLDISNGVIIRGDVTIVK